MARRESRRDTDLERSLSRVGEALAREGRPAGKPAPRAQADQKPLNRKLLGSSAALFALAVLTGSPVFIVLAIVLGVASGLHVAQRYGQGLLAGVPPTFERAPSIEPPKIGLGAEIAPDARIEPGATVEMGATVFPGAVVRSGAVVRMGATVGPGAVLEEGALVSWGATVRKDAVVGAYASVGAGATVWDGAQVPARAAILPGMDFYAGKGSASPGVLHPPPKPVEPEQRADPRRDRIDAVCDRLEAELRDSPPQVREYLGASADTVAALRKTCHDLVAREEALRAECDPAVIERLESERLVLQRRIDGEQDAAIRRSLSGAVAAIEDQKQQRALLARQADRLDAERTRLVYTLEGMAAQLVRLRSAGTDGLRPGDAELEKSVVQLKQEIDAIAQALEDVGGESIRGMATGPVTAEEEASGRGTRVRE